MVRVVPLPPEVRALLDASGLPWEVVPGSRHRKLVISGRMVAVLPYNSPRKSGRTTALNLLAGLRRTIRQIKETKTCT